MYVKLRLCHLSDQGQQKVIKSSPDCQRRLFSPFSLQWLGHLGSEKFQSRRTKIQILKAVNCRKKVCAWKKQKGAVSGLWDNGKTNRRGKFVARVIGKRLWEKLIQREYLHILRGTSVKTKQQPRVRKGEKINAEKCAQFVLFRSCMPVVIAVAAIKLPVDGTHTNRLSPPLCFSSSLFWKK